MNIKKLITKNPLDTAAIAAGTALIGSGLYGLKKLSLIHI